MSSDPTNPIDENKTDFGRKCPIKVYLPTCCPVKYPVSW